MRKLSVWSALVLSALQVGQVSLWAVCPSGDPSEFFCDDFDTYCSTGGGYPGSPACDPLTASKNDTLLREVWLLTSTDEASGALCGTQFTVEDADAYVISQPFGARYPGQSFALMGQQTNRDWVSGDLGLSRFIGQAFGTDPMPINGTDYYPLVMQFALSSKMTGALFYSNGYMELAFVNPEQQNTDPVTRANTDYVLAPSCSTYCNPGISQGPFPIICAQGNPYTPVPAGCPALGSAPVHQAIAVGALAIMDTDPCHCGSSTAHGGQVYHLTLYDGRVWWMLRSNTPYATSGTVTPKVETSPMPPPAEINVPGNFTLNGGVGGLPAINRIKLSIGATTIKVELVTEETAATGDVYYVSSVMEGIPRQYLGPFDRVRGGVGGGCPLAANTSWETCGIDLDHPAPYRKCIDNNGTSAAFVAFDDFSLSGGIIPCCVGGACCLADGACLDVADLAECLASTGTWKGWGTTCEMVACCPKVFGDTNQDGSVDMIDFAAVQACITTGGGALNAACRCFDFNSDQVIDSRDVEHFIGCAAGPGLPGSCSGIGW